MVFADAGGRIKGRARLSSTGAIKLEAADSRSDDATRVAYSSAAGAAIGSLARRGKATKVGAAIGAVGGGLVVATRGAPAVIPAESVLGFRLLIPIVNANGSYQVVFISTATNCDAIERLGSGLH